MKNEEEERLNEEREVVETRLVMLLFAKYNYEFQIKLYKRFMSQTVKMMFL